MKRANTHHQKYGNRRRDGVHASALRRTQSTLSFRLQTFMPGPTPHRTPLRRVSQGSLFALSRSGARSDAPHGLGFLEPALAELADEADALRANVDGLRALSASLDTFNEAFASWMYVMNMNALTVDWPEVRGRFLSLCNPFEDDVVYLSICDSILPKHRHPLMHRSSSRSGGLVRPPRYRLSRLFVTE